MDAVGALSCVRQRGFDGLNAVGLWQLEPKNAKALICKHHGLVEWTYINKEWEAKEDVLQLQGWQTQRRVVVARRRFSNSDMIDIEHQKDNQLCGMNRFYRVN